MVFKNCSPISGKLSMVSHNCISFFYQTAPSFSQCFPFWLRTEINHRRQCPWIFMEDGRKTACTHSLAETAQPGPALQVLHPACSAKDASCPASSLAWVPAWLSCLLHSPLLIGVPPFGYASKLQSTMLQLFGEGFLRVLSSTLPP